MDILARIKRLVVSDRYRFTVKAGAELDDDGLSEQDAIESILNAQFIKKTISSTSPSRTRAGEKLYVIESHNYSGTFIYTKGKIGQEQGQSVLYIFISAKRSTVGE